MKRLQGWEAEIPRCAVKGASGFSVLVQLWRPLGRGLACVIHQHMNVEAWNELRSVLEEAGCKIKMVMVDDERR